MVRVCQFSAHAVELAMRAIPSHRKTERNRHFLPCSLIVLECGTTGVFIGVRGMGWRYMGLRKPEGAAPRVARKSPANRSLFFREKSRARYEPTNRLLRQSDQLNEDMAKHIPYGRLRCRPNRAEGARIILEKGAIRNAVEKASRQVRQGRRTILPAAHNFQDIRPFADYQGRQRFVFAKYG